MKKFYIKPFLCVCLITNLFSNLQAQTNDFKLSDYKLPDIKRQGIDFDFNLSGANSDNKDFLGNRKTMNLNNSLYSSYFLFTNKRKYQGNFSCGLQYNLQAWENESFTTYRIKTQSYSYRTWLSGSNRFYNQKNQFLVLNFNGEITQDYYKISTDTMNIAIWERKNTNKQKDQYYITGVSVGAGIGRIEPVEDARQAIFILENLKKENRLKHDPSKEEILELAQRISEVKNERILDSRLKKIHELQQIDSILSVMDLISEADINYFSSLNDTWDYGGLIQRNSGFRFEFTYNPEFRFSRLDFDADEFSSHGNDTKEFTNSFSFALSWAKPIKQVFQSDMNFYISYLFRDHNNFNHVFSQGLHSRLNYGFGIYPNTRTSFRVGIYLLAEKLENTPKDFGSPSYDTYTYSARPNISLKYYFSPKLSLLCSYETNFERNMKETNNGEEVSLLNNMLNFRILYSIF